MQQAIIWSKALILEIAYSFLLFPLKYYGPGLRAAAHTIRERIIWFERFFAFRLSLHTLFTPLYGDYTTSGRFIGFFLRVVLLVGRSIGLVVVTLILAGFFLLYAIFPLLIIYLLLNI